MSEIINLNTELKKLSKDELIKQIGLHFQRAEKLNDEKAELLQIQKNMSDEMDGYKDINKVLSARLNYWKHDFLDQKEAHINVCVSSDLKIV